MLAQEQPAGGDHAQVHHRSRAREEGGQEGEWSLGLPLPSGPLSHGGLECSKMSTKLRKRENADLQDPGRKKRMNEYRKT